MKQYFMYGILVSYKEYLDLETITTIDDILKGDDGIQGIFTGRNGDFMIIGKVLGTIEDNNEPHVVPEIDIHEQDIIKSNVFAQFRIEGEFNYYFIKN